MEERERERMLESGKERKRENEQTIQTQRQKEMKT